MSTIITRISIAAVAAAMTFAAACGPAQDVAPGPGSITSTTSTPAPEPSPTETESTILDGIGLTDEDKALVESYQLLKQMGGDSEELNELEKQMLFIADLEDTDPRLRDLIHAMVGQDQ